MENLTKIKVIGIGGSGCNAISRMMKSKIKAVELIALNTDAQDLKKTQNYLKIQIGKKITQGLGTGMDPELGRKAALESKDEIGEILKGADMVFITFGAGGGTGTGAAPIVAEIAKNLGILTVAIVTKPFSFEGAFRKKIALEGIKKLKEKVDSLVMIENDKLFEVLDQKTSISNAFWFCDDILRQAVQGITDLIFLPGIINVDFADIKAILKNSGTAFFGVGQSQGEKRAESAAKMALNSPLLGVSCQGAKGVLFNVSGSKDMTLSEIEEIAKIITEEINPKIKKEEISKIASGKVSPNSQTKIIFGAVYDNKMKKGEIKVTLIATGF